MFAELNQHTSALDENRQPILLLLGGGMAAGKSTVREIIGHDEFWSKVSTPLPAFTFLPTACTAPECTCRLLHTSKIMRLPILR